MTIIEGAAAGVIKDIRGANSVADQVEDFAARKPLLDLSVTDPAPGVCVVGVGGELDMLTAPMLTGCLDEQLANAPSHLVIDMQAVRFLGCSGLNTLVTVRERALTMGVVLHLAGVEQRAVVLPLQATGLLPMFATYPTLDHALSTLAS
ncbi:MAG: STAS domain-containing protein [Actinomycetota bacterium]|nr:STAS domain-containing protein [Actinomycetota bacterium]MDQ2881781.1 STAS domain-containing protein [Actinomycetota bacterium]